MAMTRLILYTKHLDRMVAFYTAHYGYFVHSHPDADDRMTELRPDGDGVILLLHPAGKAQKQGQVQVKLVFDVEDVDAARNSLIAAGVDVGPVHRADGYGFANMKDPSGNAVQISGRAAWDRGMADAG